MGVWGNVMQQDKRHRSGRGITPVVSVVLMLAITVLLAATATVFLTGLTGATGGGVPTVAFEFDYSQSTGSDELRISHTRGDSVAAGTLSVAISDAGYRSSTDDPNGRYSITRFGELAADSRFATDAVVTVTGAALGGVGTDLDLSGATVEITWHGPHGDRSMRLTTWSKV